MRIPFALAVALLTLGGAERARAIDYPWCAQYTGSWGNSRNCGFTSHAQCMASVRGVGGYCLENPAFFAYGHDRRGEPRPRKRVRTD